MDQTVLAAFTHLTQVCSGAPLSLEEHTKWQFMAKLVKEALEPKVEAKKPKGDDKKKSPEKDK